MDCSEEALAAIRLRDALEEVLGLFPERQQDFFEEMSATWDFQASYHAYEVLQRARKVLEENG